MATYKREEVIRTVTPEELQLAPWEVPTPTSLRRKKAQRRGKDQATPRPALARRPERALTPEELAQVAELSQSRVIHTRPSEHAQARQDDRAGVPLRLWS